MGVIEIICGPVGISRTQVLIDGVDVTGSVLKIEATFDVTHTPIVVLTVIPRQGIKITGPDELVEIHLTDGQRFRRKVQKAAAKAK